jgi:hypothetical protein
MEPTNTRPSLAGLRQWGNDHGVPVPARGRIAEATWQKFDAWYEAEIAKADKAYDAAYKRVNAKHNSALRRASTYHQV